MGTVRKTEGLLPIVRLKQVNRGHVIRDGGIILHPSGVFSNVLMQKKRHGIRKTSDLSKSDCSLHDICQQRYLVYSESYRDEIV